MDAKQARELADAIRRIVDDSSVQSLEAEVTSAPRDKRTISVQRGSDRFAVGPAVVVRGGAIQIADGLCVASAELMHNPMSAPEFEREAADIAAKSERLEEARAGCEIAIRLFTDLADRSGGADQALGGLADAHECMAIVARGDDVQVREHYSQALDLRQRAVEAFPGSSLDIYKLASTNRLLSGVLLRLGLLDEAYSYLRQWSALMRKLHESDRSEPIWRSEFLQALLECGGLAERDQKLVIAQSYYMDILIAIKAMPSGGNGDLEFYERTALDALRRDQ